MKKTLLTLILIIVAASAAGGLYLYTIKADNDKPQTENGAVEGEEIDEGKISEEPAKFTNSGPAPEFKKLTNWLNIDNPKEPLTIAELKGKVVLVNFWTYSCNDCRLALPYLRKWNDAYRDKGLVVIGVHTPQFAFEKVDGNFSNAVKGQGVNYPVAQDNDYQTWTEYHNQFWPAMYLVDQNGNIVYTQVGSGKYGKTEKAIRTLLGMEGEYEIPDQPASNNPDLTPDIFTGLTKIGKSFGGTEGTATDEQIYVLPQKLAKNKFAIEGSWRFDQESVIHTRGYGRMTLNFNAAQANMVASTPEPITVKVYVDDVLVKGVVVKDSEIYQLFDSLSPGDHTMRLEIPDGTSLQIFSFTFK